MAPPRDLAALPLGRRQHGSISRPVGPLLIGRPTYRRRVLGPGEKPLDHEPFLRRDSPRGTCKDDRRDWWFAGPGASAVTVFDATFELLDDALARGLFSSSSQLTLLDHFRVPYEIDPDLGGGGSWSCGPTQGGPALLLAAGTGWPGGGDDSTRRRPLDGRSPCSPAC